MRKGNLKLYFGNHMKGKALERQAQTFPQRSQRYSMGNKDSWIGMDWGTAPKGGTEVIHQSLLAALADSRT